jgi:peptidoglycan-associated lipoprotein
MASTRVRITCLAAALATVALAGCSTHVTRADFDATVAELRANDQAQQEQIDALNAQMAKYGAEFEQMRGRVRVDSVAQFGSGDATLREEDKPLLDDFAKVMRDHHAGAIITVEGFTDEAGSNGANHALGQRRAEAVREYLVGSGGLSADQVRAVSYGENQNRLVAPGQTGDTGQPNRRATLVVDYPGGSSTM